MPAAVVLWSEGQHEKTEEQAQGFVCNEELREDITK